jgi:hypothetical protein
VKTYTGEIVPKNSPEKLQAVARTGRPKAIWPRDLPIEIPTETTVPDTIFPLIKRETVMSPKFKTIMMAVGAFMLAFAIFKPAAPPPPPLSAADQAKIAKYRVEEKEYWAVQAKWGPDASGFACDKTLNDIATLEVRHAHWTMIKKHPELYSAEKQAEARMIFANE